MVWSTNPRAFYDADKNLANALLSARELKETASYSSKCANFAENKHTEKSPRPSEMPKRGLFEDSDTLLILMLFFILMKEQADQKLLMALMLAFVA